MADLDLSVLIVNWNSGDYLRQCLKSVPGAAGDLTYEVIIVDNASSDDSVGIIEHEFPSTLLIQSTENLGFAGGHNLALAYAGGKFVAILNPDLLLSPGALQILVDSVKDDRAVALVGPKIMLPDGTVQSKPKDLPSIASAFPTRFRPNYRKRLAVTDGSSVRCGYIHGACMVLRRDVLAEIGGVPSVAMMYGEEILLAHRLRKLGYEVWLNSRASVVHFDDVSANRRWPGSEKLKIKMVTSVRVAREVMPFPSFALWAVVTSIRTVILWLLSPFKTDKTKVSLSIVIAYIRETLRLRIVRD